MDISELNNNVDQHIAGLRALGCAVVILTPEDVQTAVGTDENDDPTITVEAAAEWLVDHQSDVEEAIFGDYWGDTIYDLYKTAP